MQFLELHPQRSWTIRGQRLELSENDKKTGNDITDIKMLEPKSINGYTGQRSAKPIRKLFDLSSIKVELSMKMAPRSWFRTL